MFLVIYAFVLYGIYLVVFLLSAVGIDLRSGTLQFGPAQILCENEGRF
jgi:hypothetical protein